MVDLIKNSVNIEEVEPVHIVNNIILLPTFNITNEYLTKMIKQYKPRFFVYCYSNNNNGGFVLPRNLENIKLLLPNQISDIDEVKIKKNIQTIIGLITKNYLMNKKVFILSDKLNIGMIILLSFLVANTDMKLDEIIKYVNTKVKTPIDLSFDLNENYKRIIAFING